MTKTQKHISKLIAKHVDWFNWQETKQEQCAKAAKSIVRYLKGIERRETLKRFEINLKNEWMDRS